MHARERLNLPTTVHESVNNLYANDDHYRALEKKIEMGIDMEMEMEMEIQRKNVKRRRKT